MIASEVEAAVLKLMNDMETLRRSRRLYPPTHPALQPAYNRIKASTAALGGTSELLTLGIAPDKLYCNMEEISLTPGSPPAALARFLFSLGVAAVRINLPTDGEGLTQLASRLSGLHDPPAEADRKAAFEPQANETDVELVALDLSTVQVVEVGGREAKKGGSRNLLAELSRALGRDGAFSLPGITRDGELDAGLLAAMLQASNDPESMFEHLFASLAEVTRAGDDSQRRTTLAEVREFLAELVALFDPDRQALAIAVAMRHLPVGGDPDLELEPLVSASLILDAVELMLRQDVAVPDAVQKVLHRMASPASERPEGIDDELSQRARRLLVLLPSVNPDLRRAQAEESLALIMKQASITAFGELREACAEGPLREHLVRLLAEVVSLWPAEPVATIAASRLGDELVVAIDEGDMASAIRLASLVAVVRDEKAREHGCEVGVRAVVDAFAIRDKESHADLTTVLSSLGDRALPAILEALAEEDVMAVRRRLMEVVLRRGANAVPFIRTMLDDTRWFVARNAVFLLRQLGAREVAPALRQRIGTAKPQVLEEILKALVAWQDPQWLHAITRSLDAADLERQTAALRVASRIRHPAVVKAVLDRLASRVGKKLREPWTMELIGAAGRLRDPAFLPVLKEILEYKQWRVPFPLATIRREVAVAIAQIDGAAAHALARQLAADKDHELAAAVRLALAAPRRAEDGE